LKIADFGLARFVPSN